MREDDEKNPADRIGLQKNPNPLPDPAYVPSVYATAIHFRDSVNWRKDSLGQADLLFFKDGERVLQVPVSSPPDPERHRIWDGHLWSDTTDGHETVVLCDGKEVFRFDGEEHLRGFLLLDGDVHTLGQHPGKGGFCYRINGKAVFDSPKGSVLGSPSAPEWRGGALILDGKEVFYCYSDGDYHVMRGGEPFKTLSVGALDALLDIRVHHQTVHRIEKRGASLYWIAGKKETYLNVSTPSVVSCQLVPYGDTLAVKGRTLSGGTTCLYWFYDPSSRTVRPLANGQSAWGQCVLMKENWAFADIDSEGRVLQVKQGRDNPSVPSGEYQLATPLDLFVSEKYYGVALTHISGKNHLVQSHLGRQSYTFNGYFTSVRIE